MSTDVEQVVVGGKVAREYQVRTVEMCRQKVREGHKSIVICAPTGSGKTFEACMLIDAATKKKKRVMFLAPRRELIRQCSDHLSDCGIHHGIILAGHEAGRDDDAQVQVASKDTLASRVIRRGVMPLPRADLLVVDECHMGGDEQLKLLKKFQKANASLVTIGLSATPGKAASGRGLGDYYSTMVDCTTYQELRDTGFLVPMRVFTHYIPDMHGVGAREWDQEADKRMQKQQIVGGIVDHWLKHADNRPTVLFAASVAHSIWCKDEFCKRGVRAGHIDESTPVDERRQVLDDLESGALDVVCNCMILTTGWDQPRVSCIILACPTRSVIKFRQCAGRALRPWPGKDDCLMLDHAGATIMHGFPDDDMKWSLEKTHSIDADHMRTRASGESKREPMLCVKCGATFSRRPDCPECGHRYAKKGREVAIQHGLLKEVRRESVRKVNISDAPFDVQREFWHTCLAVMANKGRTCAAAAAMFAQRVGKPPWDVGGLPNLPEKDEWRMRVSDRYPQYLRRSRMN